MVLYPVRELAEVGVGSLARRVGHIGLVQRIPGPAGTRYPDQGAPRVTLLWRDRE